MRRSDATGPSCARRAGARNRRTPGPRLSKALHRWSTRSRLREDAPLRRNIQFLIIESIVVRPQRTLYKSVGVAVQDAAAAALVLAGAREAGLGLEFDI